MICHVVSQLLRFLLWELKDQGTCEWVTYFYNLGGMQDYPYNNSNLTHILRTCLE